MSLLIDDDLRDYLAMMHRRRHPIPSAQGRTWRRRLPPAPARSAGRALDWAIIGGAAVFWCTYVFANIWWPPAVR